MISWHWNVKFKSIYLKYPIKRWFTAQTSLYNLQYLWVQRQANKMRIRITRTVLGRRLSGPSKLTWSDWSSKFFKSSNLKEPKRSLQSVGVAHLPYLWWSLQTVIPSWICHDHALSSAQPNWFPSHAVPGSRDRDAAACDRSGCSGLPSNRPTPHSPHEGWAKQRFCRNSELVFRNSFASFCHPIVMSLKWDAEWCGWFGCDSVPWEVIRGSFATLSPKWKLPVKRLSRLSMLILYMSVDPDYVKPFTWFYSALIWQIEKRWCTFHSANSKWPDSNNVNSLKAVVPSEAEIATQRKQAANERTKSSEIWVHGQHW